MAILVRSTSTSAVVGAGTLNFPKPNNTTSGDVLVACMGSSATNVAATSAWSLVKSLQTSGSLATQSIFKKIAGPAEPTVYAFTTSGSTGGVILCFSGATNVENSASSLTVSSGSHVTPSLATSGISRMLIEGFYANTSAFTTTPTSATQQFNSLAGGIIYFVGTETLATSAVSTPRTATTPSQVSSAEISLTLSPSQVGAATVSGDSTANGTGKSLDLTVGTASGNSATSGVGKGLFISIGTAPGNSATSGIGKCLSKAVGTAQGDSSTGGSSLANKIDLTCIRDEYLQRALFRQGHWSYNKLYRQVR